MANKALRLVILRGGPTITVYIVTSIRVRTVIHTVKDQKKVGVQSKQWSFTMPVQAKILHAKLPRPEFHKFPLRARGSLKLYMASTTVSSVVKIDPVPATISLKNAFYSRYLQGFHKNMLHFTENVPCGAKTPAQRLRHGGVLQ